jgi:hypothetical protein
MMNAKEYEHTHAVWFPDPPISKIYIGSGKGASFEVGVDKKFNWLQKKMIKWCFGFEVKENK